MTSAGAIERPEWTSLRPVARAGSSLGFARGVSVFVAPWVAGCLVFAVAGPASWHTCLPAPASSVQAVSGAGDGGDGHESGHCAACRLLTSLNSDGPQPAPAAEPPVVGSCFPAQEAGRTAVPQRPGSARGPPLLS